MGGRGKLLDLKAWLTLSEATRHLTELPGEPVSEADILRLALDGHIVLSALFVNHTTARTGRIIPLTEAAWSDPPVDIDAKAWRPSRRREL